MIEFALLNDKDEFLISFDDLGAHWGSQTELLTSSLRFPTRYHCEQYRAERNLPGRPCQIRITARKVPQ